MDAHEEDDVSGMSEALAMHITNVYLDVRELAERAARQKRYADVAEEVQQALKHLNIAHRMLTAQDCAPKGSVETHGR